MHLKRSNIEKFWPIPRKGTKYLAVPTHNQRESIPLVVVLRDILKIVRNKKELQRVINEKQILINQKIVHEVNYPVSIFDIISMPSIKKNFRANLSKNKKMIFEEVSEKESHMKIFKVLNKKILAGKKIQLNLTQGKNILSKEKVNIGDTVVLDFKENKVLKIITLEKGKKAFVLRGKHAGYLGKIEDIMLRGGKQIVKISSDKERINVWTKNIILTE
jgi:small subunit ribosomal protein S4e